MLPHPQQVSGDVSLAVVKPCPPPLCFRVVTATQHGQGVALPEGQLIGLLGRVVPESVDQAFVHHTQLFLYTWRENSVKLQLFFFELLEECLEDSLPVCLPTVEELRTLCVALLHLFTFVRRRLHVANSCGENGSAGLDQHLTEVDAVA